MNRQQRFAKSMLELSNKSQARNTADYCVKAMPYLYSAMAIALHDEFGWGEQRLAKLFRTVDGIWNDYADNNSWETLMEVCYRETGIVLMHEAEAIEKGIINGNTQK